MQRFHRLGSVGMVLIITAFTFHLLAISYDRWTLITCKTCSYTYYFREWRTSIRQRCYRISLMEYTGISNAEEDIKTDPFATFVCIPDKYVYATDSANIAQCIGRADIDPHNACTSSSLDEDVCQCDYTRKTKAVIGFAVISSIILGLMVIVSHFASYIPYDFILKWLLPGGFISLVAAFTFIFITLIMMGSGKSDYVNRVVVWRTLQVAQYNLSTTLNDTTISSELSQSNFDIKLGFSFGMEIIAAHFTLMSAIVYALMFLGKRRPNA
ncbi:unnamed protein product [Adineta ricciae]|uniref:Uncharacterized protein n=1 Tax=Adineta ricciae TaxID=249248 RepID=A0A813ZSN3_ADIRI|nr:unnamed protein product [Adineta ricciae]CAF1198030.1 unnamed protein product [Adineta ricciae]